mmetsp:Transcript_2407/g.9061  ORF Transcript_2407/g.9061 Transcript_2407/m.9061 type:complete len:87 (+) Transcript_2407:614-874(+)
MQKTDVAEILWVDAGMTSFVQQNKFWISCVIDSVRVNVEQAERIKVRECEENGMHSRITPVLLKHETSSSIPSCSTAEDLVLMLEI